jgi:uncharacterized protein YaaW (UPF0174 family)
MTTALPLIETDVDLLPVLEAASNEMLDPLVGYITNKGRLTSMLEIQEVYKSSHPNHRAYWREIASEIQTFGGGSLSNLARGGKGVVYGEIVRDVADKLKVNHTKTMDVASIEQQILLVVLQRAYDKMTPNERQELLDSLGIVVTGALPAALPLAVLQGSIVAGGFAAYQVAVIVANAVAKFVLGRGLSLAANAALTRIMGVLAGPVGWAGTAVWTLIDLSGPAYRVTIPCTLQVAAIRQDQIYRATTKRCSSCGHDSSRSLAFCGSCGKPLT